MSQADENNLEQEEQEEKVVPVGESIRYRRRAQVAERKAGELELELAAAKSQAEELAGQVKGLSAENTLIAKLAQAGASDIEAAVLLAKTRVGKDNDIDGVVTQLKKEKPHLFASTACRAPTDHAAQKTAGAKDTAAGAASALERAARKASQSAHSRASVQEYMKLRRKF
jgi:hypothetical protein